MAGRIFIKFGVDVITFEANSKFVEFNFESCEVGRDDTITRNNLCLLDNVIAPDDVIGLDNVIGLDEAISV
jgi:hypothetical protein